MLAAGATMFRGGAYKPRTSPYAFQGLGQEGLRLLAEAKARTGLPIVTELMDARDIEAVAEVADVIQIGARNMQNYPLLSEIGRSGIPVLIKRGLSSTLEELIMAAEYVLKEGNEAVMLCERGIRTFETAYRFTLDLMAIPVLKEMTHLPIVVDPSHAAGRRDLVLPLSLVLAGARPEEIGSWSEGAIAPGAALSFAASADTQGQVVERAIDAGYDFLVDLAATDADHAVPRVVGEEELQQMSTDESGGSGEQSGTHRARLGGTLAPWPS